MNMKNLQYLELQNDNMGIVTRVKLPPDSFPMLTALKLDRLDDLAAETIWAHMPNLVTKLTTLDCAFDSDLAADVEYLTIFGFPSRFAVALNKISPHITDLSLHFDPENYTGGDYDVVTIDETTLRMLGKLPLRRLSVEAAGIEPCIDNPEQTTPACKLLTTIFPELETLRWMSLDAGYKDLCLFKDMPNLVHLGLCLDDKPMTKDVFKSLSKGTDLPGCPFQVLETDIENDRRYKYSNANRFNFARRVLSGVVKFLYIAYLWPNAQLIAAQAFTWTKYSECRISDNQYALMNKFITLMRHQDLHDEKAAYKLWNNVTAEWNASVTPDLRLNSCD
ncbi:hypothetical protein FRC07_014615 [Ceratobasidium sp. 392]|nr:hypothetical protein FRC07_014615 [Ceratobasidium sp. 392]